MRTIRQIRHANFSKIFADFKDQIRQREPDAPDKGMLTRFAALLEPGDAERHAKYLSHMKTDRYAMSEALARRIEAALALPVGWMDVSHDSDTPETPKEARTLAALLAIYRRDPAAINDFIIENFPAGPRGKADE